MIVCSTSLLSLPLPNSFRPSTILPKPYVFASHSIVTALWKYATTTVFVSGCMNSLFRSPIDGSVLFAIALYRSASFSRRHSGRAISVSYSERPSVYQRGTREFDSWIANTWPFSATSPSPS